MPARGGCVPAAARRRYFALFSAGGLGIVLVVAVIAGPHSPVHHPASPAGTARPPAAPPQDAAAAKLAAEANAAANPETDNAAEQALAAQPSWNTPPKVVRYHGYQFQVPGSWPVYDLSAHPTQCVLLRTHAVYLGSPGAAQDCPATAIGRTETLLVEPASAPANPAATVILYGQHAALPAGAALPSAVATTHMFQVGVPAAGVLVTATFGDSESRLRVILAGATLTSTPGSSAAGSSHPAAPGSSGAAASGGASSTFASSATAATQSVLTTAATSLGAAGSAPSSPSSSSPTAMTVMTGSGLGFDTCSVPSVATMTAWLASPYRIVGTYLGGMNWACGYGDFSASWVRQVGAEGWRFVPIWIGRQSPCSTIPGVAVIDPAHAAAEGRSDAKSAVAAARKFGYGPGSPLYFDMEGYQAGGSCSSAVLHFLNGWTRQLHAAGYQCGVYSSAASGIKNLVAVYNNRTLTRPDDIWTADWTSKPVLTDSYVPASYWSSHQRLHQYSGPHNEKWGGDTLNIDTDAADGQVAGTSAVPGTPRPTENATPSQLAIAPGRTATVTLTLRGSTRTAAKVTWQAAVPKGIAATPSSGTVILGSGDRSTVKVTLAPSTSVATGRYLVPVTLSTGSHTVADAYILVSVARIGKTLPTRYPVVLYAADAGDMAPAVGMGRVLGLPAGDVTGSFTKAWQDADGNQDLVLAVGLAAANALYFNACGWTDPAGWPAGSTPFYYPGYPLQGPPGKHYFELSSGSAHAVSTALMAQLTQYALSGTLSDGASEPMAPSPPTLKCLGSPNVRVP